HLPVEAVTGPVALIAGDLSRAQRFLPVAHSALIDTGEDVLLIAVDPDQVEPVDTIFAYPYGRFRTPPSLTDARRLGAAAGAPVAQMVASPAGRRIRRSGTGGGRLHRRLRQAGSCLRQAGRRVPGGAAPPRPMPSDRPRHPLPRLARRVQRQPARCRSRRGL